MMNESSELNSEIIQRVIMEPIKTGTTTIGIVCKDGIVLAADQRVTAGQILNPVRKIININDRFATTIAGHASDALMLTRYLKSELKLKELRSNNPVTVKEAANLLAQFVFSNVRTPSMHVGITHFLFAGADSAGTNLYDIFPDGSVHEITTYFSSGSGSVYALGVLDAEYKDSISVKEATELAKKGIRSAIIRDNASGNGYNIVSITKDGVKEVESVRFDPQMAQH